MPAIKYGLKLTHMVYGGLTGLASTIYPLLSIIMFLSFVIYELDEDFHLKDGAWKDFRDFMIGLTVALMVILWRS